MLLFWTLDETIENTKENDISTGDNRKCNIFGPNTSDSGKKGWLIKSLKYNLLRYWLLAVLECINSFFLTAAGSFIREIG